MPSMKMTTMVKRFIPIVNITGAAVAGVIEAISLHVVEEIFPGDAHNHAPTAKICAGYVVKTTADHTTTRISSA